MLLDIVPCQRPGWTLEAGPPVVLRHAATGHEVRGDDLLLAIWNLTDGSRSLGEIVALLTAVAPEPAGTADAAETITDNLVRLRALGFALKD